MSDSAAHIDKREKLTAYQQIKSLKTYLIVHQNERRLEHHWLDAGGRWQHVHLTDGGRVPLECPNVVLNMNEIYEDIRV